MPVVVLRIQASGSNDTRRHTHEDSIQGEGLNVQEVCMVVQQSQNLGGRTYMKSYLSLSYPR